MVEKLSHIWSQLHAAPHPHAAAQGTSVPPAQGEGVSGGGGGGGSGGGAKSGRSHSPGKASEAAGDNLGVDCGAGGEAKAKKGAAGGQRAARGDGGRRARLEPGQEERPTAREEVLKGAAAEGGLAGGGGLVGDAGSGRSKLVKDGQALSVRQKSPGTGKRAREKSGIDEMGAAGGGGLSRLPPDHGSVRAGFALLLFSVAGRRCKVEGWGWGLLWISRGCRWRCCARVGAGGMFLLPSWGRLLQQQHGVCRPADLRILLALTH